MRQDWRRAKRRRGSAAVMAMVYLGLMAVLALAMASMATMNTQIAYNHDGIERARANAEMGLRWLGWRFHRISMPTTAVGYLDSTTASNLWTGTNIGAQQGIMSILQTYVNGLTMSPKPACSINGGILTIGPMTLADGSTFSLTATPGSLAGLAAPANQAQVILVKSTGTYRTARRAMTMQFLIQKSMRYGVVSKIPIQLGKNTVVEGDVYMAAPPKAGQPPILSVSDFRYTSATTSDTLTTQVQKFQDYLNSSYGGYDNRIQLSADSATATAQIAAVRSSSSSLAGISDYNQDGYLDESDLFYQYFDKNGDGHIRGAASGASLTGTEFAQTAPLDPNLFYVIDQGIGKPINSSDTKRPGYNDGYIDALDPYAKVNGHVMIWETASALATRLASEKNTGQLTIAQAMQGTMISPDGTPAVQFGCTDPTNPATQLTPSNFTMGSFLALAGTSAGPESHVVTPANPDVATVYPLTQVTREYANTTITAADANAAAATITYNSTVTDTGLVTSLTSNGDTNPQYSTKTLTVTDKDASGNPVAKTVTVKSLTQITENVPYGSTNPRSTVTRKVFSGVNFKNCVINRGTNALFVNCTFDGVTFVDGAQNMGKSVADYANGNNLRFEGCTFTGPIAQGDKSATDAAGNKGPAPTSYTDYTNSWEFTGATAIDLSRPAKDGSSDSTALANLKEQATIVAPQTNIEMGSFTAPGQATCSFQGVVVAGCFDCRGVANIDGTIIIPQANGGGNSTLGYFGPDDNVTNQGQPDPSMSKNGAAYGGIHIRFNPYRSLPDGINLAVSMLPDPKTWCEVTP